MSNIEALWTARFGDVEAPNQWVNGGVVVFETGRLFGGDGGTYYVGSFETEKDHFTAQFKTVIYDPQYRSAFGNLGSTIEVVATGNRIADDKIIGEMHAKIRPDLKIKFDLTKRAELP